MHRIDGFGATVNNLWTKGDPATATPATHWTPEWANDSVQEEIAGFIESRGITLNKADPGQFEEAIDDLVADTTLHGRRNLLRNGGFEVCQFATSITQGASQTTLLEQLAGPDGWRFEAGGGSTSAKLDVLAHTIGQNDVPRGGKYYLQWTQQVASNGADHYLETRTDDVVELAGKQVTFSFYADLVAGSTDIEVLAIQDAPGGFGTVSTSLGTETITAGWAHYEFTGTLPALSGSLSTRPHMKWRVRFTNDTGTFTVALDNCKAEVAPAATPFVPDPIGITNMKCERYFCTTYPLRTPTSSDKILPEATQQGKGAVHQLQNSGNGNLGNYSRLRLRQVMDHQPEVIWYGPGMQLTNTVEWPDGTQLNVTPQEEAETTCGYPQLNTPPANSDDVGHGHFIAAADVGQVAGVG